MRVVNSGNIFASLSANEISIILFADRTMSELPAILSNIEKKVDVEVKDGVLFGMAHIEESADLLDEYEITKLPAFLFFYKTDLKKIFYGSLKPKEIEKAIKILKS